MNKSHGDHGAHGTAHFNVTNIDERLQVLQALGEKFESGLATVNEIKTLVEDLKAKVEAVSIQITALPDHPDSGGVISQADFDSIGATLQEVKAQLVAIGQTANLTP